jgi:pyruvate oxidase
MADPYIADTRPKPVELKAGDTVWWCTCGRSKSQPFCDGSHQGTEFTPMEYTADKDGKVFFCQCKRTGQAPLCDGSHKDISQDELDAQDGLRTAWYKVAEVGELKDGEVRAAQAGTQSLALTCYQGQIAALDNACPHQGGPLGEGSIECSDGSDDCWLRCPWHGWDFHPLTGRSPGGHEDGSADLPGRAARRRHLCRRCRSRPLHTPTVSDRMAETMVNWGVKRVFGMVGHSNLGLADALRRRKRRARSGLCRHPPRGRGRLRRLGLRQADRQGRRPA